MDGMLGFDTMYRFFNDPQHELRAELVSRGFVINNDAMIHAGYTWPAVTAMLSPGFYDDYFGELLAETNHLILGEERRDALNRRMTRDIGNFANRTWAYAELFSALREVDYTIVIQSHAGRGFSPFAADLFYSIERNVQSLLINNRPLDARLPLLADIGELRPLLFDNTPLSLIQNLNLTTGFDSTPINFAMPALDPSLSGNQIYWARHANMLYNSMLHAFEHSSSPRVVITTPYFTHYSVWDETASIGDAYANNHTIAAVFMLQLIDLILSQNPNAVIVLQGDHGFHAEWVHEQLRADGISDADLFELSHSTISAVRIPEAYGGLDTPLDPLNISRELVNRFVGQNYEMTTPHVNPLR